jgi:hypothetical protein
LADIVNFFIFLDAFSHSEAFLGSFMLILHGNSLKKTSLFPTFQEKINASLHYVDTTVGTVKGDCHHETPLFCLNALTFRVSHLLPIWTTTDVC